MALPGLIVQYTRWLIQYTQILKQVFKMKRFLLIALLLFPLSSNANCTGDALRANGEYMEHLTLQETNIYLRLWCDNGKPVAENYLVGTLIKKINKIDSISKQLKDRVKKD